MYNPQFCVHWQPIVEDHMAKTTKMSKKIILKENSFEWDSGYSDGWYHQKKHPKIGKFTNTLFESENERQKIKPVPIPLPKASRNFPNVKTRNDFFFS